jgi:hypothetical protein
MYYLTQLWWWWCGEEDSREALCSEEVEGEEKER